MKKIISSVLLLTMLSSSAVICFAQAPTEGVWEDSHQISLEDWIGFGIQRWPNVLGAGCNDSVKTSVPISGDILLSLLWNMEGSPVLASDSSIDSTDDGALCCSALKWAIANGIVGAPEEYCTHDTLTREQAVTILYRYAMYKGDDVSAGENTNILSYDDVFSVSDWAIPAVQWACGIGMLSGKIPNLKPKELVAVLL